MRGGWVFWALLAVVLLFAIGAARAQEAPPDGWPAVCRFDLNATPQVDNRWRCGLEWGIPTSGVPAYYEIRDPDNVRVCAKLNSWSTPRGKLRVPQFISPYDTNCSPRPGEVVWLVAVACDEQLRCGDAAPDSTRAFVGLDLACWTGNCEVSCGLDLAGNPLPLRFPKRQGCP